MNTYTPKRLEWEKEGNAQYPSTVRLEASPAPWAWYRIVKFPFEVAHLLSKFDDEPTPFRSIELAKAAAQAHYEAMYAEGGVEVEDAPEPESEIYEHLKDLAVDIWKTAYNGSAPDWEPLEDSLGVITQIDNMVAGLLHAPIASTCSPATITLEFKKVKNEGIDGFHYWCRTPLENGCYIGQIPREEHLWECRFLGCKWVDKSPEKIMKRAQARFNEFIFECLVPGHGTRPEATTWTRFDPDDESTWPEENGPPVLLYSKGGTPFITWHRFLTRYINGMFTHWQPITPPEEG